MYGFPQALSLLPGRIRRRLPLSFPVEVRLQGRRVRIPLGSGGITPNDVMGHLRWNGSWKAWLFARLVQGANPTFVDVGANIGQTLLEVFVTHPEARYIGFEPNLACAQYVKRMIQENRWESAQIIGTALGSQNGLLVLFLHRGQRADSGATVLSDLRPDQVLEQETISCLRFDDLRATLTLERLDLVKVDVEGAELEVIAGMEETLRTLRPVVICEVLFTDSRADLAESRRRTVALMRRLAALEYGVWQIIKTADLKSVLSVKPIAEFPLAYWTAENAELCDYLFLPKERAEELLKALVN